MMVTIPIFLLRFSHVIFCVVVMWNDVNISLFFHVFVHQCHTDLFPCSTLSFSPRNIYIYIYLYTYVLYYINVNIYIYIWHPMCLDMFFLTASLHDVTKEWWFIGRIILIMWPSFGWRRQTQKQTIPKITMLGKPFPRSHVVSFMAVGFPH